MEPAVPRYLDDVASSRYVSLDWLCCIYALLIAVSVIGLQYYHVAKIVLAVSSSPSPAVGYENLKHLRNIEVSCSFMVPSILFAYINGTLENDSESPSRCPWPSKIKHQSGKCPLYCSA